MPQLNSLSIYDLDGNLLFVLDGATFRYSNKRSTESFEIPGVVWNTYFDNENIIGTWDFSGVFVATDEEWDTTNYRGRPFDFIHRFKSAMNRIDVSTGALQTETKYKGLQLVLSILFNETQRDYNISKAYNQNKNGKDVVLLLDDFDVGMRGGIPSVVDWSFKVVEVSNVESLGRR